MPSDALAVHQYSRDLVFTGQRSGLVTCEDLRVKPKSPVVVGGTRGRKAVVNVKRVQDGAVPWGLVVSGMGDEVSFCFFFLPCFCHLLVAGVDKAQKLTPTIHVTVAPVRCEI